MVNLTVLPFTPLEFFDDTAVVASNTYIETAQNLAPHAVAALALLLLFFFVVRHLMGKVANPALALPLDEHGLAEDDAEMRSPANDPDADLASRLRLLVDNYQPVDASDLNRLVNRESAAAAQVVRQWKRNNS